MTAPIRGYALALLFDDELVTAKVLASSFDEALALGVLRFGGKALTAVRVDGDWIGAGVQAIEDGLAVLLSAVETYSEQGVS